jgi:hypothetical protein
MGVEGSNACQQTYNYLVRSTSRLKQETASQTQKQTELGVTTITNSVILLGSLADI